MTAAAKNRKEVESAERPAGSDRRAYYANELPKTTIEAIKRVRMDSRHDHLNSLLDP